MNISKAIYYILSNHSGLNSLVSNRIYPVRAPQAVLQSSDPYVVFDKISIIPTNTQDAVSKLDYTRVRVHVWSKDYTNCEAIATTVRSALDRLAEGVYNTVRICNSLYMDQTETFDDEDDYYSIVLDFNMGIHTS